MGFRAMFGWSQVELHPIIGDFPSGFTHRAVFCALFVRYRNHSDDMNEDTLGLPEAERQPEHATLAPERKMPHIARSLAATLGFNQLVVFPECAVEETQITLIHGALGAFSEAWNARRVEESLVFLDELEANDRFFRRKIALQRIAHVVRKTTKKRHCFAKE